MARSTRLRSEESRRILRSRFIRWMENISTARSIARCSYSPRQDTFDEYQAARFMTELTRNAPVRVQSVATSDHPVFSDSAEAPWVSEDPGRDETPFFTPAGSTRLPIMAKVRGSTPGLVVTGWGQILRRPIANRRFKPLSLADRQKLKRLAEKAGHNWRDDEWDAYADRQLSPV
jgi:hypothetical protein